MNFRGEKGVTERTLGETLLMVGQAATQTVIRGERWRSDQSLSSLSGVHTLKLQTVSVCVCVCVCECVCACVWLCGCVVIRIE